MGYYNGNGIITGGGEAVNLLKNFYYSGNAYAVRQLIASSTLRKPGVSLATAQAAHNTTNLTAIYGGSGIYEWAIFDCEGTRTIVAYSQIGESNLYELTITTETLACSKVNTGNGRNFNNL